MALASNRSVGVLVAKEALTAQTTRQLDVATRFAKSFGLKAKAITLVLLVTRLRGAGGGDEDNEKGGWTVQSSASHDDRDSALSVPPAMDGESATYGSLLVRAPAQAAQVVRTAAHEDGVLLA